MRRVGLILLALFLSAVTAATTAGRVLPAGEQLVYLSSLSRGQSRLLLRDTGRSISIDLELPGNVIAEPAWSPDGRRLAYVRVVSPAERELNIFDLTTGQNMPVTSPYDPAGNFAWSADGTRLAYHFFASQWIAIYDLTSQESFLISPTVVAQSPPLWSPDGRSLMYVSFVDGIPYLRVVSEQCQDSGQSCLDRGRERWVTQNSAYWPMSWSPDQQHLVFNQLERDGWRLELLSITCDDLLEPTCIGSAGTVVEQLRHSVFPFWSPDGSEVAFLSSDTTQTILNTVNITTGTSRQVMVNLELYDAPAGSPGSGAIAVTQRGRRGALAIPLRIMLLDAHSGQVWQVIDAAHSPRWRPGSNW
ncbi:MAG: PD40 domain-containing protein [Anaerolineae bacterium]|nr:PD40 domain-containing protein [Anaerolineae bacterium]